MLRQLNGLQRDPVHTRRREHKNEIAVAPANEVEIVFNDRSFIATFNMRAVCYMQEELIKLNQSVTEIPIEEFGAIVLYSGIKVNHTDYTIEEAKALAMSIRPADLNEIITDYLDSSGSMDKEMEDAITKKSDSSDVGWAGKIQLNQLLFDFDFIFYLYCVKMKMSELGFWKSSLVKIIKLIDIYNDEKNMEIDDEYETKYFKAPTITSMKELEGFGSGESI